MKTQEEIMQLAEKYYPPYPDGIITDEIRALREGFIKGYRCQEHMVEKKYTQEDLKKAIDMARMIYHIAVDDDGTHRIKYSNTDDNIIETICY